MHPSPERHSDITSTHMMGLRKSLFAWLKTHPKLCDLGDESLEVIGNINGSQYDTLNALKFMKLITERRE
ncbi:hypothetical protein BDZ89DRAFT_1069180 [Hymenopellis radicata]|nr:hypothetical protein BDZ89DRAFT_1069180 [Hymenopellis radicata]